MYLICTNEFHYLITMKFYANNIIARCWALHIIQCNFRYNIPYFKQEIFNVYFSNSRFVCMYTFFANTCITFFLIWQVEGSVTVQPLAFEVKGFKDYFMRLTPLNNKRNPWFVEFWEQQFRCKYPGSSWTPYNDQFNVTCSGQEQLSPREFEMEAQLQFVSDATMSFAHALNVRFSNYNWSDCFLRFYSLVLIDNTIYKYTIYPKMV